MTLILIRRALTSGFWNAVAFGSGSISADLFYITLVYVGIAPLLADHVWLRVALWTLGALWLAWLGIDAIRSARRPLAAAADAQADTSAQSFMAGVGVTLLNPLTIVGWITLGGSYLALYPEAQALAGGLLALGAVIAGLMSHVVTLSGLMALGRRWLRPGWVRVFSGLAGVVLLVIALNFAVSALQAAIQQVAL